MESYVDLQDQLLQKLGELARRLLEPNFYSAQEVWQFELDLVKFQSEQQQAILQECKARRQINAQLKETCTTRLEGWELQRQQYQDKLKVISDWHAIYEHTYNLARKLGDALAWVCLDRIQLLSRTHRSSTPTSDGHRVPKGHGLQGMLVVAEALANAGAGFPLLHDITNCLRVGDLTFIFPGRDPFTIEVKTKLKGYEDGKAVFSIAIYSASEIGDEKWLATLNALIDAIPTEVAVAQGNEDDEHIISQQLKALEERLIRQLEAIGRVSTWQAAQPDQPFKLGEKHEGIISHLSFEKSMHHYDVLQELAVKAKSTGLAWKAVDDTFMYLALYKATSLQSQDDVFQLFASSDTENFQHSLRAISLPEEVKNRFRLYDVCDGPSFVPPFFLYPLATDLIVDIMRGRLQIFILINYGKLVAALEEAGFDAQMTENNENFDDTYLQVFVKIPLPNGRRLNGRLKGLQHYGAQLVYEFLSLQGFVELISHMAQTTTERAKNKEVYEVFFPSESKRAEDD